MANEQHKGGGNQPQHAQQQPQQSQGGEQSKGAAKAESGPVERQVAAQKAEAAARREATARPPRDGRKRYVAKQAVIVSGVAYGAGSEFDADPSEVKNRLARGEVELAQ